MSLYKLKLPDVYLIRSSKTTHTAGNNNEIFAHSSIYQSQATTPSRIISARDGRPAIAIFAGSGEAYAIGCSDLDKLWGGMDYQYVTGAEYDKTIASGATRLTGYLGCDPSLYKAYVHPAIRGGNTIVLCNKVSQASVGF
jgi:hypothetical protein